MFLIAASVIALLGLSALSEAQITRPGQCPSVTVQLNFNLTEYLGVWYEIQRYEAPFQQNLDCTTAEYSLADANVARVTVVNSGLLFNGNNATFMEARGVAVPSFPEDERVPAKLSVAFFGIEPDRSNYWVLGSDYHSYSLVYSCEQVTPTTYEEYAWVLSRTKNPSAEFWAKIYGLIAANNVNTEDFRFTEQSDRCLGGIAPF